MTEQRVTAGQRIGDAERERTAALLGEHVGDGRLELAEFEERVGAAYAARTRGDLDAVVADLPGVRSRTVTDRSRPRRSPDPRRGLRVAVTVVWANWLASTVVCLLIWGMIALAQGTPGYFWPVWVFGPWGAMLLIGTVTGAGACGSRRAPHGA